MKISLVDLKAEYQELKTAIDSAIDKVIKRGIFVRGPQVKAFEKACAHYIGVKEAVGVASGTDALILILEALGMGQGDEVIVPAFTFYATAEAVMRVGATPVFCDVEAKTGLMTAETVERCLTKKTKALLPVHLFGQSVELNDLKAICRQKKLWLIEDAAQAFGATYGRAKCGSLGIAAAVSFYPSKNIGAYGDGGLVLTQSSALAKKVRLLGNHGSRNKARYTMIGYNSRLDELQAAVLNAKLSALNRHNRERRAKAELYRSLLAQQAPEVKPLREHPYGKAIYHMFVVRAAKRNALLAFLRKNDVLAQVHYPMPLHLQPVFRKALGYKRGDCPSAEKLSREVISLPLFPQMKQTQVRQVVRRIAAFYRCGA